MISSLDLLPHMRHVLAAERDLRDLGLVWQMIESSATISCPEEAAPILPTLVATRHRFDRLQARLIDKLVEENPAELGDELSAVAQCAIDILVRNLYERTADVGFLATDEPLRHYCAADADTRIQLAPALHDRLVAYQAKYSVYEDIILLDLQGQVLARLANGHTQTHSQAPLVAQALQQRAYVEFYGPCDLAPDVDSALLYAHAMLDTQGRAVGVLVLRFRFADEMHRIFDAMADSRHDRALVLIDAEQRVIASNDPAHIPRGAQLRATPHGQVSLSAFAGREYVTVCCPSLGYQGYRGPGWRAVSMVSLLTAFRRQEADDQSEDALAPLDNPELVQISADAGSINRELRRTVWNGRLMANAQQGDQLRLKAVLGQVHQAGSRTRNRVSLAIRDLYLTALARARGQAQSLAQLAADILDRNLYERANDCRWWALSPAIQQALETGPGKDSDASLQAVLKHINGLYTVYSQLLTFDNEGRVRGSSHPSPGQAPSGGCVPAHWLQATRALQQPAQYAVSPFETNPWYPQGATYVYLAAVRSEGGHGTFLGGVAIVFDAATELAAMLRDVLGERAGFAAFMDDQQQLIACTDPALREQSTSAFQGSEILLQHAGAHYACIRVPTRGYREFKTSDGYDHRISAVVGLRLGAAERRRHNLSEIELHAKRPAVAGQRLEAAVFSVGPHRYALPSHAVMMAVPPDGLVRTPGGEPSALGLMEIDCGSKRQALAVVCARHRFGVSYPARNTDGVVLVLRSAQDPSCPAIGLRVDDVLGALDLHPDDLHPTPAGTQTDGAVQGLIDCHTQLPGQAQQPALVQMLDPAVLLRRR